MKRLLYISLIPVFTGIAIMIAGTKPVKTKKQHACFILRDLHPGFKQFNYYQFFINRKEIYPENELVKIPLNCDRPDVIEYVNHYYQPADTGIAYAKFKPDVTYIIAGNDCSGFDIFPLKEDERCKHRIVRVVVRKTPAPEPVFMENTALKADIPLKIRDTAISYHLVPSVMCVYSLQHFRFYSANPGNIPGKSTDSSYKTAVSILFLHNEKFLIDYNLRNNTLKVTLEGYYNENTDTIVYNHTGCRVIPK